MKVVLNFDEINLALQEYVSRRVVNKCNENGQTTATSFMSVTCTGDVVWKDTTATVNVAVIDEPSPQPKPAPKKRG